MRRSGKPGAVHATDSCVGSDTSGSPTSERRPCLCPTTGAGAAGQRMVGLSQSGNGAARAPRCRQDGSGPTSPGLRPAPCPAPPPPKGGCRSGGTTMRYPTWIHRAENEAGRRYGHCVAVKFGTEAEAPKAALDHCLRELGAGPWPGITHPGLERLADPAQESMWERRDTGAGRHSPVPPSTGRTEKSCQLAWLRASGWARDRRQERSGDASPGNHCTRARDGVFMHCPTGLHQTSLHPDPLVEDAGLQQIADPKGDFDDVKGL